MCHMFETDPNASEGMSVWCFQDAAWNPVLAGESLNKENSIYRT